MSVCVRLCVFVWEVRVCEWRGEFSRVVLVVQLRLIFYFILNPEQRRVFQLVMHIHAYAYILNTEILESMLSV
jgi:hypothetical protein